MSKNQTPVNEPQGEELVGNLELTERQLTFLYTVQSYLNMQIDLVEVEIEKITSQLNPQKD